MMTLNGIAFFSLPIDLSRETTWEPPAGTPLAEVERICGWDHKRLYGRDFVGRLEGAGFMVSIERPTDEERNRYRLLEQDVFFVCRPVTLSGSSPGALHRNILTLPRR